MGKPQQYELFSPRLIVKALRDSGYRNAAYALAELMDNSIQAGANNVELLCQEVEEIRKTRKRGRIDQIGVLDNGSGMSKDVLRIALMYGNGTYLSDRTGIGRFGMGLPNSSMSQAERVDVWTWQDGIDSAIHSYLDLGEIASGHIREVPEPTSLEIPLSWRTTGKVFGDSGTIVVWSRLDRCKWRTARAIIRNSEEIIGRIYRRFISDKRVAIRLAAFKTGEDAAQIDEFARPNDPCYLMSDTSCPGPWDKKPMFEPWGEVPERIFKVEHEGETHHVHIRYSIAKKEATEGHAPGGRKYGKHAARNNGVSVMRADRELDLDPKWMPAYEVRARWIGVEIDFPPALDEVFGVTNNKQSATHLADLAGYDTGQLAERLGFGSYQQLVAAWREEDDPRLPLLEIQSEINGAILNLLRLYNARASARKAKGKKRYADKDSPEAKATQATTERKKEGHTGTSDQQEEASVEEKKQEIEEALKGEDVAEDPSELATDAIEFGAKYIFAHADSASGAFFSVKPKGGAIIVTLNTSHPAYEQLMAVLESEEEEEDIEQLRARQAKALTGLKLLLLAWARYEDEEPDGPAKIRVQDAREDWGRVARHFLMDS